VSNHHGAVIISELIELAGVAVLVGGIVAALLRALATVVRTRHGALAYRTFRSDLGKAILIGLEFLVAADIIRSIAITLTFESVSVLGLIVLVRTFLSWSLEVEVSGTWPWERTRSTAGRAPEPE
jgi:uncharacterized membrane protein